MDIRTAAVAATAFLHLRDKKDNLMYEAGPDGQPDESKPVGITLYGPGSKEYNKASVAKANRLMDRVKKKKADSTAEENTEINVNFFVACTEQFHHIELDGLTGVQLQKAVYAEPTLGYIPEQVSRFLNDWGNF